MRDSEWGGGDEGDDDWVGGAEDESEEEDDEEDECGSDSDSEGPSRRSMDLRPMIASPAEERTDIHIPL